MQGPSPGAWSEEKPQTRPKELNRSPTGCLAALHGLSRPQGDTSQTRGALGNWGNPAGAGVFHPVPQGRGRRGFPWEVVELWSQLL